MLGLCRYPCIVMGLAMAGAGLGQGYGLGCGIGQLWIFLFSIILCPVSWPLDSVFAIVAAKVISVAVAMVVVAADVAVAAAMPALGQGQKAAHITYSWSAVAKGPSALLMHSCSLFICAVFGRMAGQCTQAAALCFLLH